MEHLDAYEADGIDAAFVDGTRMEDQMGARMAAERELRKRDRREGRLSGTRRLPGALAGEQTPLFPRRPPYLDSSSAAQNPEGGRLPQISVCPGLLRLWRVWTDILHEPALISRRCS